MQSNNRSATYRFPKIDMRDSDNPASAHAHDTDSAKNKLQTVESQAYQMGYAEAKEQTLIDEKSKQQP